MGFELGSFRLGMYGLSPLGQEVRSFGKKNKTTGNLRLFDHKPIKKISKYNLGTLNTSSSHKFFSNTIVNVNYLCELFTTE